MEKHNDIILFYRDIIRPGNISSFSDIVNKWSDYKLETAHDYISWLFPPGDVLTQSVVDNFKSYPDLRKNAVKAAIRMMNFYGYDVVRKDGDFDVVQIKELYRVENGKVIGLYSPHNYPRLTRIMVFLNNIGLQKMSALIFLMLCRAIRKDELIKAKVKVTKIWDQWLKTQEYIKTTNFPIENNNYNYNYNNNNTPIGNPIGLVNINNSCYIDSVLMALFGRSNNIVNKYILNKPISSLIEEKNKSIVCGSTPEKDFKIRTLIQDELKRLAKIIRNEANNNTNNNTQSQTSNMNNTCTNLRKIIKHCKTNQSFASSDMQDAGEFLIYIFNIFNVQIMKLSKVVYVTNDLSPEPNVNKLVKVTSRVDTSSPIYIINLLGNEPEINLERYTGNIVEDAVLSEDNLYKHQETKKKYRRKIDVSSILETSYLIFNVQRASGTHLSHKKLYTPVIAPENLIIGGKTQLFLTSIITHVGSSSGGHYTCYVKLSSGDWIYYDDFATSYSDMITTVGDYNDMLRYTPSISTSGTLYFYT